MHRHILALASLFLLGACSAQSPQTDNRAPAALRTASAPATIASPAGTSSASSSLNTDAADSASSPPLHTIGQVTRHAKNFLGTRVRMQGYLLKKEAGYVLMSDESSGPLTIGDLPVTGPGIELLRNGNKYLIEGMFIGHGLTAANHNPNHLELAKPPELAQGTAK